MNIKNNLVIGLLFLVALISYYLYKNKEKGNNIPSKSGNLVGLKQGSETKEFEDTIEAVKMCLPPLLKNTIMSLSSLSPISIITDSQVARNNTNPQIRYGSEIREGLFYIKIGGKYLARLSSGDLYLEGNTNILEQQNLFSSNKSFTYAPTAPRLMPVLLKYVSSNDSTKKYVFQFKDIIGDYKEKYVFQIEDIGDYQDENQFKNIGVKPNVNNNIIVKGQQYIIFNGNTGLIPKATNFSSYIGDQWINDANIQKFTFEPTGEIDNSWLIRDSKNGKYFTLLENNIVYSLSLDNNIYQKWYIEQNSSSIAGGFKIKSKKNGKYLYCTGERTVDFLYVGDSPAKFWGNGNYYNASNGPEWYNNWGILKDTDFTWYTLKFKSWVYDYGIPSGSGNVGYMNQIDWAYRHEQYNPGIDQYGPKCFAANLDGGYRGWNNQLNLKDTGEESNVSICTYNNKLPRLSTSPSDTIGVLNTTIDDDNNKFEISFDLYNRMFIKNIGTGLYISNYGKNYSSLSFPIMVPFNYSPLNQDHMTCELIPVLNQELAHRYFQATINYLNTESNTLDKRKKFIEPFCGSSPTFSDGILKIYSSTEPVDSKGILTDPVKRAFESICACNMGTSKGEYYDSKLCSDEFILDKLHIKDPSLYNEVRDTLKCKYPNCSFDKCRNVYKSDFFIKAANNTNCGEGTNCVSNQTINNSGNIIDTKFNISSTVNCGAGKFIPKSEESGVYKWLDTSKNKLGKSTICKIYNEEVASDTPGCGESSKVYFDFTNSSIDSDTFNNELRRIVIKNTNIVNTMKDPIDTIKDLIFDKYKSILSLPDDIDINYNNGVITISHYYTCGNTIDTASCSYDSITKKWKTNTIYSYDQTKTINIPSSKFSQVCSKAPTVSELCKDDNDCKVGDKQTISLCSPTSSNEVYRFPIIQNSSAEGKSCSIVTKNMIDSKFTSNITDNYIEYSNKCGINNSFEGKCTLLSDNLNKLVDKVTKESCSPLGNSDCKDKVCIDWKTKAEITTFYDSVNKIKTIKISGIDNDITRLETPEVIEFIKSKLTINDYLEIKQDGPGKLIVYVTYDCGTPSEELSDTCYYDTENNKWIINYKKVYKTPINVETDKLNSVCPSIDNLTKECNLQKDCELEKDVSVTGDCVNGNTRLDYLIKKNRTSLGKSCLDVAKQLTPGYTFSDDVSGKIKGFKTCTGGSGTGSNVSPSSSSDKTLTVVIGVLVLVLVGGGGFYAMKKKKS